MENGKGLSDSKEYIHIPSGIVKFLTSFVVLSEQIETTRHRTPECSGVDTEPLWIFSKPVIGYP